MTLKPIDPAALRARLKARDVTLVDIREPDEFARERIPGAQSAPLSTLDAAPDLGPGDIVFHCRSGMRTSANGERLAACAAGDAYVLTGGLDAWRKAGFAVHAVMDAPLEMNRQVQITVGALMLVGVALSWLVSPAFIALPALLGSGLLFAGVSGWCGMAKVLALAPWNKPLRG